VQRDLALTLRNLFKMFYPRRERLRLDTAKTQSGHSPDRNPAAQQCRGVLFLSFESTGGTGR
jgi:hypothetical protein